MKNFTKKILSVIFTVITILSTLSLSSLAVSWPSFGNNKPIKAYTISTGNNTIGYSNASLTSKKGTIYASDECYIYRIGKNGNGKYVVYCSWPISNGRKNGYVLLSAFTNTVYPSSSTTAKAGCKTYRRSNSSNSYGSVYAGDKVYKLSTKNGYTQIVYNIGSASSPTGWKMAWITTSDYNSKICGKSTSNSATTATSSTWQYPMTNAYCTWTSSTNKSWGNYTNRGSNRSYHIGIDIWGSTSTVYAAASGTVVACSSSTSGANGRYIIIKHTLNGKTIYSFYAHLSSVNVSNGQTVSKNQKIGIAGGSGYGKDNYYGSHLHFAIVDTLWTSGGYYGYATYFSGNKVTYSGVTYYNPCYVIAYNKLP